MFTYRVMRDEWVAQIGFIEPDGNPNSFKPYWTSEPRPTRAGALELLYVHPEVLGPHPHVEGRLAMEKAYTHGQVTFRRTEVDVYEGE